MTLNEFLTTLKNTPRRWKVTEDGALRLEIETVINEKTYAAQIYCPITSILGKNWNLSQFKSVGTIIGLSDEDIQLIADSADYHVDSNGTFFNQEFRESMMKACGLEHELQ